MRVVLRAKSYIFFRWRSFFKKISFLLLKYPRAHNLAFRIYAKLFFSSNSIPREEIFSFDIPLDRSINSNFLNMPSVFVFDCQSLQSGSFYRGIGRYSRSFIKAFADHNPEAGVILYFNNFNGKDRIAAVLGELGDQYKNVKV
jgi:hypothetical protein